MDSNNLQRLKMKEVNQKIQLNLGVWEFWNDVTVIADNLYIRNIDLKSISYE